MSKKRTREQMGADFAALRESLDGDDNFMQGHRIIDPRRPIRKENPDWALSVPTLGVLIKKMFPRAGDLIKNQTRYASVEEALEDQRRTRRNKTARRKDTQACKQANRAGMYLFILYRYFLEHKTAGEIAGDMTDGDHINQGRPITAHRVDQIIQECRYAAAGLRRNGLAKSNGKRGPRPKNRPIPLIVSAKGEEVIDLGVYSTTYVGEKDSLTAVVSGAQNPS